MCPIKTDGIARHGREFQTARYGSFMFSMIIHFNFIRVSVSMGVLRYDAPQIHTESSAVGIATGNGKTSLWKDVKIKAPVATGFHLHFVILIVTHVPVTPVCEVYFITSDVYRIKESAGVKGIVAHHIDVFFLVGGKIKKDSETVLEAYIWIHFNIIHCLFFSVDPYFILRHHWHGEHCHDDDSHGCHHSL